MVSYDTDRILLDVETQNDFFSPEGSCYTETTDKAAAAVVALFNWARKGSIPVISTVLRVRRTERGPLSPTPHCIDDSFGEQKFARTVLPRRINLGLLNTTDLPSDLFERYQQIIFEKRDTDLFAHPRAERLITEMPLTTFVICGAGLARSIAQAAIGLRTRGFGVIAASDAILDLGDPMAPMALRRMEAKGVVFAPTREIINPRVRKFVVPMRQSAEAQDHAHAGSRKGSRDVDDDDDE